MLNSFTIAFTVAAAVAASISHLAVLAVKGKERLEARWFLLPHREDQSFSGSRLLPTTPVPD
jgi:hypothetical protein